MNNRNYHNDVFGIFELYKNLHNYSEEHNDQHFNGVYNNNTQQKPPTYTDEYGNEHDAPFEDAEFVVISSTLHNAE